MWNIDPGFPTNDNMSDGSFLMMFHSITHYTSSKFQYGNYQRRKYVVNK